MAVEAYIPSKVDLDGEPLDLPRLITLYDPQGSAPTGSLTGLTPLQSGEYGLLAFQGHRDGKPWRVVCPEMTVTATSALGCEFKLERSPTRTPLADLPPIRDACEKGQEG